MRSGQGTLAAVLNGYRKDEEYTSELLEGLEESPSHPESQSGPRVLLAAILTGNSKPKPPPDPSPGFTAADVFARMKQQDAARRRVVVEHIGQRPVVRVRLPTTVLRQLKACEQTPVVVVEDKAAPRVTAADVLARAPPSKRIDPRRVVLRLPPAVLRQATTVDVERLGQEPANPFFTAGSTSTGMSLLSVLSGRLGSPVEPVPKRRGRPPKNKALATPSPAPPLSRVENDPNPFLTKGDSGSSGLLVLHAMVDRAMAAPKLTALQQAKSLEPPFVSREAMHVGSLQPCASHCDIPYPSRQPPEAPDLLGMLLDPLPAASPDLPLVYSSTNGDIPTLLEAQVPTIHTDPRFSSVLGVLERGPSDVHLWSEDLKPTRTLQVLVNNPTAPARVKSWLADAFTKLSGRQAPRFSKARVVDDFIDDGSDDELDGFVPLMVVSGPVGSGKSLCVHAAAAELLAYVHEVNLGVPRGRKDLQLVLQELSTTQLVRANESGFQKGLVLFEDVDVLFEQDTGFWPMLRHVLGIGRRPVVVTCRDAASVPQALLRHVDSLAIVVLQPAARPLLHQYLHAACLVHGFDVDRRVVAGAGAELRQALANLQTVCGARQPGQVVRVAHTAVAAAPVSPPSSLEAYAARLSLGSTGDVIHASMRLSHSHTPVTYETLGSRVLCATQLPRVAPMPHELNTGFHLTKSMPVPHRAFVQSLVGAIRQSCVFLVAAKFRWRHVWAEEGARRTRSGAWPDRVFLRECDSVVVLPPRAFVEELAPVLRAMAWCEGKYAGRASTPYTPQWFGLDEELLKRPLRHGWLWL